MHSSYLNYISAGDARNIRNAINLSDAYENDDDGEDLLETKSDLGARRMVTEPSAIRALVLELPQRGMIPPPLKINPPLKGIPPLYFRPLSPSFTGLFSRHITMTPSLKVSSQMIIEVIEIDLKLVILQSYDT